MEELGLGASNGVRDVTIIMGGQDLIVNTRTVSKYLVAPTVLLDDATEISPFADGYASGHAKGHSNKNATGNATVDSNGCVQGLAKGPTKGATGVKLLVPNSSKDYFGANLPVKTKGEWKSGPWKQRGLNLLWFEHLDHAQVFDKAKSRSIIAQVIERYSTDY